MHEDISDLQAVDFSLGKILINTFRDLALTGPKEFQRFVQRIHDDPKTGIFLAKNDDVQNVLTRIAQYTDDPDKKGPDLPAIVYYRDQGLAPDMNQHPQVIGVTRFDDQNTIFGQDKAMRLTTIPITLSYSILFLAWDRATIDRMALAWWGYILPLRRRHSAFFVTYDFNDELVDVPCMINAPRDILTSSEAVAEGDMRLWGSRTICEISTQALYGAKMVLDDYFRVAIAWDRMGNEHAESKRKCLCI